MSLLNLDQVRELLLDGENVAELIYNGKTIWQGNTIALQLKDSAKMGDLASNRIFLMIFPKEAEMRLKAAINSENIAKTMLVYPDEMHVLISFDLNKLIEQTNDVSVSKLTLNAMSINQLVNLLSDETNNIAKIKTESTKLIDTTGIKITAGIRASLGPSTREIKDLDPISTELIHHSSGYQITTHGGQSVEEVKTSTKRDSSAVKSTIFSAFPEKTDENVENDCKSLVVKIKIIHADPEKTEEIVSDASKRLGLRVAINSIASDGTTLINSSSDILTIKSKVLSQNVQATDSMKYTSAPNVSTIYSDGHLVKIELKMILKNEPNAFVAYSLSILPITTIEFNNALSQHISQIVPCEQIIKNTIGMKSLNDIIVELLDAHWETPVVSENTLKITQAYFVETNGTKLIIQ